MVFIKLGIFFTLNYLVIFRSLDIDFDQLKKDLNYIGLNEVSDNFSIYIVAFTVSVVSLIIARIFKPFMDLYILHYFKFSFYVVINLLSISSVYIIFRIYGYSRFFLIFYLILISGVQIVFEKIDNKFNLS